MDNLIKILPPSIVYSLSGVKPQKITEVRLRVNQKLCVKFLNKEQVIDYIVSAKDLVEVLKRVSANSIYSIQNSINYGFITALRRK